MVFTDVKSLISFSRSSMHFPVNVRGHKTASCVQFDPSKHPCNSGLILQQLQPATAQPPRPAARAVQLQTNSKSYRLISKSRSYTNPTTKPIVEQTDCRLLAMLVQYLRSQRTPTEVKHNLHMLSRSFINWVAHVQGFNRRRRVHVVAAHTTSHEVTLIAATNVILT